LVFEGFKRSGRGFDGDWLHEGRGRDGARLGFLWCTGGARRTTAAAGRTVAVVLATEGGRRAPGGPWAGVPGWAECHLGRRGEKTKRKKKNGMGCKDDWAKIKGGLAENSFSNFESRI
jgi:hypothetical protein